MRVIAGALKGRRLESPRWAGLRPTSDRLRETLFDVLGEGVVGAVVLDGFAGTGALGLEALSRGASTVVFVERDRRAAALIAANLDRCGVRGRGAIVTGALPGAFARAAPGDRFDLILLDPPYAYSDAAVGAILSAAAPRLAPGGRVVLECARRSASRDVPELTLRRRIASGDSALVFYGGQSL
ncbi:MAG: 16S rRNA (guanine(966)-N(2))-methyltransferase RsmD [Acidobacteria bacterium]|nr:16S rRNA (guanine(966)-N(2))-methyltransferase RsmD [Acidobacteriota bacterium]